ncbi:glycosyltransferase family 4 protein [Gillisia marina]|uniref:glycosyltransferase family 4 protein n=1 Tax=Gillisia marina TaxID=1167637 RepID=UPI00029AD3A4|nr:glycosyltransferase [Gillisia marina]
MKIALCSKGNFSLEKGFTKNRIELAEALHKLGWETVMVDKQKLGIPSKEKYNAKKHSTALKEYLINNCYQFDVVLYEYDTLPFNRNLFDKNTLFVARPAILDFHFSRIKFRYNLKTKIARLIRLFVNRIHGNNIDTEALYKKIEYSLNQSDLIQVQNTKDRNLLITRGFNSNKIIIVPNGISSDRISMFKPNSNKYQEPFILAFVGTFDFRKGAMDFSDILSDLKNRFPSIKLKLLGTIYTADWVFNFFPKKHHSCIEVIPKFKSEDLPELLKDCTMGFFPSYLESFGFGALEMMCAGLPVVAYKSPGPSDFILPELLVPTGDRKALSKKIIALLENKEELKKKSKKAREIVVRNYCWEDIAKDVDVHYKYHFSKRGYAYKIGVKNINMLPIQE